MGVLFYVSHGPARAVSDTLAFGRSAAVVGSNIVDALAHTGAGICGVVVSCYRFKRITAWAKAK